MPKSAKLPNENLLQPIFLNSKFDLFGILKW